METILSVISDEIKNKFNLEDLLFHASVKLDKHTVKKNNRPVFINKYTGKAMMGKNSNVVSAEKHLSVEFKHQSRGQLTEPYTGSVWIIFHFYFKHEDFFTLKGTQSKFVPDLSNLYALPEDCLQAAGVILNDSQVASHDLSRRLVGPETRLDVFVLKYKAGDLPLWKRL